MRPSFAEAARLALWFSPSFPTGAFGFSHGLECAVEAGDVADRDTLLAWIGDILEHGGAWSDAVLVAAAYSAAAAGDEAQIGALAELAEALQPSRERRLETLVQGEAFAKAVGTGWPDAAPGPRPQGEPHPLPVAIGVAAARAGLALEPTLAAFLAGVAANLVSAAIRLAPIGQSDGLRVLAALEPRVARLAYRAARSSLDDLGTSALRSDIASMRHETQMTRLFRS